ncbi:interleukin 17a/f1 isoform X1 [Pseudoliparis swirei]|uniref:interleukin 17a/f1 isoform X1 n=1 Tax=Pseudoliparis swirei TaxID=2059687 RepID=UPI0024BEE150|nr:interleukin 17a/f1 isoform X1 [Pseudoliparis swirei]
MWSSTVSAACVVMMMMMTMTKAVAMPKGAGQSRHSARTHRKSSDGVVVETVPLQLDPSALVPPRHARPLQNISVSPWTYNFIGGPLFAARLSGLRGPGGPEPGVQTHHAPGAAAAPGQVSGGGIRGGAPLPLPAGVPPPRCGLHLHPTRGPTSRLKTSRDQDQLLENWTDSNLLWDV